MIQANIKTALTIGLMGLLSLGGFWVGMRYQKATTVLPKSIDENLTVEQKQDMGTVTKLPTNTESKNISQTSNISEHFLIEDGVMKIWDNGIVRTIVDMETFYDQVIYRVFVARKNEPTVGTPDCSEGLYIQKENMPLIRAKVEDGCEATWIGKVRFFSDRAIPFFQIAYGGEGAGIEFFDFEGKKVSFMDEEKVLDKWTIGEVIEHEWQEKYDQKLATFKLSRALGSENGVVAVDLVSRKVINSSFKQVKIE